MAHQRKLIRDAVKAALIAEGTDAGTRVINNRTGVWPIRLLEQGPACSVYAVEEAVIPDSKNTSPKKLSRILTLAIEGAVLAAPAGDVDDAIDELALQIERAMHRDQTFGDTCGKSTLTGTLIEITTEGETEIGNVRLAYDVEYFTHAPERADVELDNLKLAQGPIKLPITQDDDDDTEFVAETEGGDP